jgi:hypothetical protein
MTDIARMRVMHQPINFHDTSYEHSQTQIQIRYFVIT